MELMEHNQQTLDQLEMFVKQGQDCCVVNPCGSGKTSVMAAFIRRHPDKSFMVFTKQKNAKEYYESKDPVFKSVSVRTYTRMRNDFKKGFLSGYKVDYFLVDEAHYLGADKWGEAFDLLRKAYKPIVIGFTATSQRFEDQGTDNTIVESLFGGNSAGNFTTSQLQKKGVFKEPEYILSLYDMKTVIEDQLDKVATADLTEKQRENFETRLMKALKSWEDESCPEKVLNKALPGYMYKECCNRILVYVSRVSEIEEKKDYLNTILAKIFPDRKIKTYRYTYEDPESNLRDYIKEEDDCYIKVLYSVDKIMETVHIDDLNIAIMLRPSVSNRIITQQFGRLNSIGNPRKPLIIDMVDNLGNLGKISFANVGIGLTEGYTGPQKDSMKINLNLTHVSKYSSLFSAIDAAVARIKRYTIDGFTGSLSQISEIYCRDYQKLKELVAKDIPIEKAIALTKPVKAHYMTQNIFDGIPKWTDFSLNEIQQAEASKYIPTVDRFIKSRNITEEDVIQELYLEMMFRIWKRGDRPGYMSAYIVNGLNGRYMKMYRDKHLRSQYFVQESLTQTDIPCKDLLCEKTLCKTFENDLLKIIDKMKFTERETVVLTERFGLIDGYEKTLEEIGKKFNVCRDRIRQIEAKAIGKCRVPSRFGGRNNNYRDVLEAFEEISVGANEMQVI